MDTKTIISYIENLCTKPSPTGFTKKCEKYLMDEFKKMGYEPYQNNKGNVIVPIYENKNNKNDGLLLSAHIDTLGLMIRSIKEEGGLQVTTLGGFPLNYGEFENVKIFTRDGKEFEGVFRLNEPSVHGSDTPKLSKRSFDEMEVVLDEIIESDEDVENLGIGAGDFVAFDPRFRYSNGFIKSRHLDDKASSGVLLALAKEIKEENLKFDRNIYMMFTTYEEVGHGASSGHPEGIKDMIAVDMGVVYDDLKTNDRMVSICAKDSSGPYNFDLTNNLINTAKEIGIDFAVDIYPFYGSDASAAMSSFYDYRHALVGCGISASHGYERCHEKALMGLFSLLKTYIKK
ncbi:M42 family metallopeptidase [Anaerococcus senegalensis]|uniref:M42 family metallopeptidase n=1 Tax=Anaerococcus senegalensis TaxID=1288120 RepID=UPI00030C3CBA|nr:M42 family metallopeptidase [Anaerococcus senegalensis]